MHRARTKVGITLTVIALAVAAVGAYAYWTGSGTGEGSGTAGTAGSVVLTGTIADGAAPGTAVAVGFTAANDSDSPIQVTTVHMVSVAPDAGHAACDTDDFSMADITENHAVPAGATVEALPVDGSLVYANTGVSQDACKGATLTVTLTSS
jgi:hypothetical protein